MENWTGYTLKDLRELREDINREIEKRRMALKDERFNAMMKAIHDFMEVCPDARACDYEDSISINYIADRDNWEF